MALFQGQQSSGTSSVKEKKDKKVTVKETTPAPQKKVDTPTIIGNAVSVEGSIDSSSSVEIHGELKGTITGEKDITVGSTATVTGDISADTIHISGTVHGNVQAKSLVELSGTAHVIGDINAKTLSIVVGASLNGNCKTGDAATKSNTTATSSPSATIN